MATNQHNLLQHITVNRATIDRMLETMREFGSNGWEVLVLWVGDIEPNTGKAHVVQAFVPKQKAISNEDGVGYFVNSETLFQLNRDLSETGLRLIAQVHSHPREAYHSKADDRYAIVTAEGGLSLVVPDFGKAPADPTSWAVYRLHGRDWREVSTREVATLFEIIDDL
jgi:Prokaryotic homologs of the JAB domain